MTKYKQNDLKIPAFLRQKNIKEALEKKPKKRASRLSSVNQQYDQNLFFNPFTEPEAKKSLSRGLRKMVYIGQVEQFFEKIDVLAVTVSYPLRVGDRILVETEEGMFEQTVSSMQIEREDVRYADQGSDVGIKVKLPPLVNGKVYKVL
jgi:hypothetical protein